MFKLVTDLMLHEQLRFEKGRVFIFNRPSSLLPSDSFLNIQKELEKRSIENLIYFSAKDAGRKWFEEMNKSYNLKGKDVIMWGSNIVTLAGWGEAIIEKRDDKNKIILFELKDSVISELYGAAQHPVDHMFRGLLAGAMSFIYDTNMDGVEIKCKSIGDSTCKILVKQKSDFDFSNSLVSKQLKEI